MTHTANPARGRAGGGTEAVMRDASKPNRPATLADVKAGDEVVLCSRGPGALVRVERATPTQIHVAGKKFKRASGDVMGKRSAWWPQQISVEPHDFRMAVAGSAKREFGETRPFTQAGVMDARVACDAAESALRELGEWKDATDAA